MTKCSKISSWRNSRKNLWYFWGRRWLWWNFYRIKSLKQEKLLPLNQHCLYEWLKENENRHKIVLIEIPQPQTPNDTLSCDYFMLPFPFFAVNRISFCLSNYSSNCQAVKANFPIIAFIILSLGIYHVCVCMLKCQCKCSLMSIVFCGNFPFNQINTSIVTLSWWYKDKPKVLQ